MRAYLTGGNGFAGRWLRAHLQDVGDEVVPSAAADGPGEEVDVTDGPAIQAALVAARPDAVYHLAAVTHVGQSWAAPEETFRVNALGTLHVLEAARACPSPPRVLLISSAEVYGAVSAQQLPVTEDTPLAPVSPYAASKVAAEYLGIQAHLGRGLHVLRARSFNHVGPGQAPTFVVPALARQVLDALRSGEGVIRTGNLSARRDFTDVRDVVRAYRLIVELGQPGGAYNVCTGTDVAISDILDRLIALAGAAREGQLRVVLDPERVRPVDLPVLLGDSTRLRRTTGWQPEVSLDETLAAVLQDLTSR